MTTAPGFRALCAELLDELQYQTSYETNAELQDRARTALATPPPEPPADGDKEESERLRSLFDWTRHQMADALGADRGYGWTSLAMEARQLREDRALATPPPEPVAKRYQAIARHAIESCLEQREEVLAAFIAKHGFHPEDIIQVEQRQPDGTSTWRIERRAVLER
jgi:hypothetical protein